MLEDVTDGDVTITEVRVEQTEDGSVDTTGYVVSLHRLGYMCRWYCFIHHVINFSSTDILFFTVQPVNNEVVSPYTVIR